MSVTLQAPPSSAEFITGLQARRRLNCGYSGLVRAALLGQIRVEILPGLSPRLQLRRRGSPRRATQAGQLIPVPYRSTEHIPFDHAQPE